MNTLSISHVISGQTSHTNVVHGVRCTGPVQLEQAGLNLQLGLVEIFMCLVYEVHVVVSEVVTLHMF